MTQNTYGGPPQGYPQQQPAQPQYPQQAPQGPPPGANPFQQAGPAGAPAQPAGGDPFSAPGAPVGGGDSPGMHQLGGRLLLIRPTLIEKNAPGYQGGRPGDLVRADVIVCDGEPIPGSINGVTEQFTPFAGGPKVPPFYISSMYVRGAVMPGQLEPFIAGRGQVLGRVVKGNPGKEGKPPWILADPTESDKIIGRQIHERWDQIMAAGQALRPDQFGGPAQQAPPQQPQYPQQAPQGYPQQAPAQQPQQAPAQQPQQWPPAAGVPQGVPEPGAPVADPWATNEQGYQQPQQPYQGQQPYPPY